MLRPDAPEEDAALRHGGGAKDGAGFNAIRDGTMDTTVQHRTALHRDFAGACADDMRAHGVQTVAQINDFRLLGGVFDAGRSADEGRCEKDVFRCAHGGKIQVDAAARQVALQRYGAGRELHLRPQGFHPLEVQINGTLTDGASAGERHAGVPGTRKERAHHQH